jgi:uncharacterized protein
VNGGAARPLPSLADPVNGWFWAACAEGRLEAQRCQACGVLRWPPARRCPRCLEQATATVVLSGRGAVWSHARYERALHPGFDVPYVVLAVELDQGPVMIASLHGSDAGLAVGVRVRAVFTEVAAGLRLPQFELARA